MRYSIFLLFSIAAFAQSPYERGVAHFKDRQYEAALPFLEEAIDAHPSWHPPLFLRAQCHFKLKQYKRALVDFNEVLTMELPAKDLVGVKYYIAKSHMGSGAYEKAVAGFDSLLEVSPQSRRFDLHFNKARAEISIAKAEVSNDLNKGEIWYDRGIKSLAAAIDAGGSAKRVKQARYLRAFSLYRLGQHKRDDDLMLKSIAECKLALGQEPDDRKIMDLMINVGLTRCGLANKKNRPGIYHQVAEHLQQYVGLFPDDAEANLKLGKAYQGAKRHKDAVKVLSAMVKVHPKRGDAHFVLGASQMASKQYAAAVVSFDKAIAFGESANALAYQYKASSLLSQKKGCYQTDLPLYQQAAACLERGIAKASGAKAQLSKPLARAVKNLETLNGNLNIENANHAAAIENVNNFRRSVSVNLEKLEINRERYIKQPTEELAAVIEEIKALIQADKKRLSNELAQVKSYLKQADGCGGNRIYTHYGDLKVLLAGG